MGNLSAAEMAMLPSFINYCYGTDAGDVTYWEGFLKANPAQAPLISEARELVRIGGWMLQAEKEKAAALHKLDGYLAGTSHTPARRRYLPYIAAAAAVAAIVVGSLFLFKPVQQPSAQPGTATAIAETSRKGLTLPDNSFVLLEHGAVIEHTFNGNSRTIKLKGTAYFKVAKDEKRPFSVLAGPYIITALGTSFRINARPDSLQVMLEEGKVKVEQQTASGLQLIAVMAPADRLDLHTGSTSAPARSTFRPTDLQVWKAQEIVFDNTSLDEAVRQIEACYNIRIQLKGIDPKKETFSGRFRNDQLTEVLEVLCFTLNKKYEITDDSTYIVIH